MDITFSGDDIVASFLNGLEVCKIAGVPVWTVSLRDDLPARLAALRAGAKHYLPKPVNTDRLIEILDALTGRQKPAPYRILLVDDDQEMLDFHQRVGWGEARTPTNW